MVNVSPVGMKSISNHDASYVFVPASALKPASLFVPLVFVDVFGTSLGSLPSALKCRARPVDKMTPVSLGVTPGAAESPLE